jgi:hypothetical protein
MNKDIMIAAGYKDEVKLVEEAKCPTCRKYIKWGDWKDTDSIAEYRVSGMCQACQDSIFG